MEVGITDMVLVVLENVAFASRDALGVMDARASRLCFYNGLLRCDKPHV